VAGQQGQVYGHLAELYERARPGYPNELIDEVIALVGAGSWALDAGCGTGKAAALLAARALTGVGVDLDPAMAEVARLQLGGWAGWRVDVSAFEDWSPGPGDAPFDLVVSAQAWHWFQPEASFRKVYGILRPGGWLVLWWNGPGDFNSDTRRAIERAYAEHAPEIKYRGLAGHPRPEFGPVPDGVSFGTPLLRDYPWVCTYTAGGWVDLVRTSADHQMLPEDRREAALAAVARAIDAHGGTYEHPYVCRVCAAQRL